MKPCGQEARLMKTLDAAPMHSVLFSQTIPGYPYPLMIFHRLHPGSFRGLYTRFHMNIKRFPK